MFHSKSSWRSLSVAFMAMVGSFVFLSFSPTDLSAQSNLNVATRAIQNKYQQMNGQNGDLGMAQSEVRATYDNRGYFRDYERGAIYWHPQYGIHEVHGAIFRKWYSTGRAGGLLGYPLTDETRTADGNGRYSKFEHGVIYWHPSIGNTAYEVHGGILAKWTQLGSERSPLGYPITDEHDTPNRNGRMSLFQYGAIYWIRGSGGATVEYSTSSSPGLGAPKWVVAPTPAPTPTPAPCYSGLCTAPGDRGYHISNLHTAYCSSPDYDACTGVSARTQFSTADNICLRWNESGLKNENFQVRVLQSNSVLASDWYTSPGGQYLCKSIPVTLSGTGAFVAELRHNDVIKGTISWSVAPLSATTTPAPSGSEHTAADNGLNFLNDTDNTLWLALGYQDSSSGELVASGWHKINPGQTRTLVNGDLTQRYYYFYAYGSGNVWEGNQGFWIHPNNAFGPISSTLDTSVAQNQGYTWQGFRPIDTGRYTSYTYTLYP